MTSFGEKLRQEREARDITLREIATETKIGLRYLEALEAGDFSTLPGGVFNKGYVRAFATYIGADAEDLVRAYVEEERKGAPESERDVDVLRALAESKASGSSRRAAVRPAVFLVPASIALVALAAWAYLRLVDPGEAAPVAALQTESVALQPEPAPPAEPAEPVAAPVEPEATMPPPDESKTSAPPPVEAVQTDPPPEVEPAPAVAADSSAPVAASSLSVPESGVGTGIANRRLQGAGDQFSEGTQIWFWTRVLGGEPGDRVRHVWLRDGRQVSSVELNLGGPHWRTQSRKTLLPGSTGQWAVEARDTENRVLAREEFVCVQ